MKKSRSVLVVVDVQGKLARTMHESDALVRQLAILIQGARLLDVPIIWTEQVPGKLGPTIPEISSLLSDQDPLVKTMFSCVRDGGFSATLHSMNPERVVLCGIETHVCVYQTARDLLKDGYTVEVVADAVSSRNPLNKEIGLDRIVGSGGSLTSVETFLFELQEVAEGDRFRQLIRLIK